MKNLSLLMTVVFGCLVPAVSLSDDDPNWVRIKLDERFRSEGVSAADFNNDGTPDVAAGDVWYEAPDSDSADHVDGEKWKLREIRQPGEFVAGKGYSNSFANLALDIDQDGWVDQVIIGFPGDPFHWYRNPGKSDDLWKEHLIWTSVCNESPEFEDLNADGVPEFVMGSQPQAQMGFLQIPDVAKVGQPFEFHAISETSTEPADSRRRGGRQRHVQIFSRSWCWRYEWGWSSRRRHLPRLVGVPR